MRNTKKAEGKCSPRGAILKYLGENPRIGKKLLLGGAALYCEKPAADVDGTAALTEALAELVAEGRVRRRALRYELAPAEETTPSPAEKPDTGAKKEKKATADGTKKANTATPAAKPRKQAATNVKKSAVVAVQEPMTRRQEGEVSLQAVRAYLTEHKTATRQEILGGAIRYCGLSEAALADESPQSPAVRLRSRMGQVLTDLISSGEAVRQGSQISLKQKRETAEKGKKVEVPPKKQPKVVESSRKKNGATAAESVILYLAAHPGATRKAILDGVIASYGLTEQELKNRNPNSKYVKTGSLVGSALTALIDQGSIQKIEGEHRLTAESVILVKEAECESEIRRLLKRKKYRRRDLMTALSKSFGTDTSAGVEDDAILKRTVDRVLEKLLRDGEVVNGDGGVLCMVAPLTSEKILSEAECKKALFQQLVARDGHFFERFLANALEKHFLITGRRVTLCNIAGGSNDGGIDVEIRTVDELGFSEYILVQAKCRESIHVTEKEVREFYGALHARRGSRGIFVTTSVFHSAAQAFLDSLDNCVGVDGDRLFEILKQTEYGVKATKNGYTVDPTVF